MPAEYLALAQDLPGVYQEDVESFAQLDGFLGMVDELFRGYLDRLADLPTWLSPAGGVWPPGLPADAGAAAVQERLLELYDSLAEWFAFSFPGSWGTGPDGLARRRKFLGKAAQVWRRRGTPRGFLDWFCLYFGIARDADRPLLLEHFKYGVPTSPAGEVGPEPWLRATLLVPVTVQFEDYGRRREAAGFVSRYAPSHVLMRLCWTAPGFSLGPEPDPADEAATAAYRGHVGELLCTLVDETGHGVALHLGDCIDEGSTRDRVDVGRLPTRGAVDD